MTRVVLVPGVLALLPEYAGIEDPVAELRAAALDAVAWLGPEVAVLADAQGARVAAYLLEATDRGGDESSYLVVGNGGAHGHRLVNYDDTPSGVQYGVLRFRGSPTSRSSPREAPDTNDSTGVSRWTSEG